MMGDQEAERKRILVVDDEKDFAELIKLNLENTELYEVELAHDGKEAMSKIKKTDPDLVILDIMMPEKDGFAVLKELRGQKGAKWRPVIILTAKGDFKDISRGYDLEADHYLTKPFDMDVLLRSIHTVLSLSAARDTDDHRNK